MSKTFVQINAELPTGSLKRIADFLADAQKISADHKASRFLFTINGGDHEQHEQSGTGSGSVGGRTRSEAGERAAQDFADEAEPAGAEADAPAEPVKRRGRPPGSGKRAEASGSAAGQRNGSDGRGAASGGTAQGSGGNEPVGTRQGAGQGGAQGTGGRGSTGGSGGAQRGNGQAPRVSTSPEDRGEANSADDWGDEDNSPDVGAEMDEEWWSKTPDKDGWPDHLMPEEELTADLIADLASEHHIASGAKDRAGTIGLIKEHSGGASLPNAHPDTYDAIVRALLRDTAKYKYGVKKPAK